MVAVVSLAETLDRWIGLSRELGVTKFRRDSEHAMYRSLGRIEALDSRAGWDVHPDIYTLYEYWPYLPIMHLPGIDDLANTDRGFDLEADWVAEQHASGLERMSPEYRSRSAPVVPQQIYEFCMLDMSVWYGIACSGPGTGAVYFLNDGTSGWSAPSLACVYERAMKLVEQDFCYTDDGDLWLNRRFVGQDLHRRLVEQFGTEEFQFSRAQIRNRLEMERAVEWCLFDLDDFTATNLLNEPGIIYAWRW